MKRLYLASQVPWQRAGTFWFSAIIAEAREIGYRVMRLDTVEPVMKDAVAMYRRMGFREIAPYCANPVAGAMYMELKLVSVIAKDRNDPRKLFAFACHFASSLSTSFAADGQIRSLTRAGTKLCRPCFTRLHGKGPFPGIIVIHEWWGLNDWVKEQASKLARSGIWSAGHRSIPRQGCNHAGSGSRNHARSSRRSRQARSRTRLFEYLSSQSNVKKDRIAAIGWCMGGGYSLWTWPCRNPRCAADSDQLRPFGD